MSSLDGGTWSVLPPKMRGGQSSAPLKRSLSVSASMANIPPLPKLSGDMTLEVFTHKSLRFEGAPRNEEVGDSDRLAVLGGKVLDMVVANTLFNKRPMLQADEIESETAEALSDGKVDGWISLYRLREKLRCTPDALQTLRTPKETRHLFDSYVGAVFFTSGLRVVQDWIAKLVDPESEPPTIVGTEPEALPAPKRQRTDPAPMNMSPMNMSPMNMSPPPPMMPPPPMPPASQPQMSYLQLFNQTANQRRLAVEYPAMFSGPPHAGQWTVTCRVNGVDRGHGAGQSKQVAKEQAAQQAFYALGWGQPLGSSASSSQSVELPLFSHSYTPAPQPTPTPPPPAPAVAPPPLPSQPNPLAPAQPNVAFLPIFNQTAAQRRHHVEYPAEFVGPAHAGNWCVKCLVDGIEKGQGNGASKQLAKEEAAKQAYYNMGWAPRG
ncbi:hypothetical protein NEOLEDRAFT_43340 [Neolentinus lepideus HHB14362 ss-1]|uniref:DRBM domain-containing protein n=1 Tax=Neolentinus lepideus HHB14362 ss-1 TaxID=1314782 RepID=A0A165W9X2_9AGAM|nr:hypothetical protein NEOLEDRAFT_43340 [Neolentinus lepideus HHB14362 ss-1]